MKKNKKIIIGLLVLLLLAIIIVVSIRAYIGYMFSYDGKKDEIVVQKGEDIFNYIYREQYSDGKRWELYINENYAFYVEPFEGLSYKEMREHLENVDLIKTICDEGNIRVYAIPFVEYESKYEILYTVNGIDFYRWNENVTEVAKSNKYATEAQNRLTELYKYVSEEELEKWSKESWDLH
ncbi:MAG: hypothetical protein J1E62_07120 [Lachnospiraceae bacterium]|nr:hypothetical protein [Lachnospiraceae bacterium]